MRRFREGLALGLLAACGRTMVPPSPSTLATAAPPPAPTVAPPSVTQGPPAPAEEASSEAPPGTLWVRRTSFAIAVPQGVEEVSPAHWELGDPAGRKLIVLGVSVAPFTAGADAFVRHELESSPALASATQAMVDEPGAPGWRQWNTRFRTAPNPTLIRGRYISDRNRTVFAICSRDETREDQDATCRSVLASLRTGAAAQRSTRDPNLMTVAENDLAIEVPTGWTRTVTSGNLRLAPTLPSPEAFRNLEVFVAANPNTADVQRVIDGSIAGAGNGSETPAEVRERRVQRVGGGTEGLLVLRTVTPGTNQQFSGRAFSNGRWAWAAICFAADEAHETLCARSLRSFEAIP